MYALGGHGDSIVGFLGKFFGGKKSEPEPDPSKPFMEHPSDEFASAKDAIVSAMERLDRLPKWDRWITFSGQGQGAHEDAYEIADVRVLGRTVDLGSASVDLDAVLREAGLASEQVAASWGDGRVTLAKASAQQMAAFLDALFRVGLGIRPFEGETDYAVGAEW